MVQRLMRLVCLEVCDSDRGGWKRCTWQLELAACSSRSSLAREKGRDDLMVMSGSVLESWSLPWHRRAEGS